jgi:hypothetical protein
MEHELERHLKLLFVNKLAKISLASSNGDFLLFLNDSYLDAFIFELKNSRAYSDEYILWWAISCKQRAHASVTIFSFPIISIISFKQSLKILILLSKYITIQKTIKNILLLSNLIWLYL